MTLATAALVHAQGTFAPGTYASDPNSTYSGGVVEDLTVSGVGPTGHGLAFGNGYQAQYYIGAAGISDPNQLSPVGPVTGFLGTSASDKAGGAGFWEGNGNQPISTSFAGGSTVSLMLWAWQGGSGSTLANATVSGHSQIYQFVLGGAGSPAGPPTSWGVNPNGPTNPLMANFGIAPTPEPTTIALGLMGAGALFIRRRKV